MRFHSPEAFFLLILLVPILAFYIWREKNRKTAVRFSNLSDIKSINPSFAIWARHILIALRLVGFSLLIIALARPQSGAEFEEITTQGIDIMIAMDISGSMAALDFKPANRLEVAKRRMIEFIDRRHSDRIGLVIFAARAVTLSPLTLDYGILRQLIENINFDSLDEDGTAIGTAIATAANRLRESPSPSRVLILLTDGANNRGEISPIMAARAAAELGIRIHTIAIGREGMVPFPVRQRNPFTGAITTQIVQVESDVDVETLKQIAEITGGMYFRAENSEELQQIYATLDEMERSAIQSRVFTNWSERFHKFLIWGFVLLTLEFILRQTRFRRIP